MFQAFVIVLREGFEAFLIVAVIAAYLAKTRHSSLLPAVYWGIFVSILTSAFTGYLIYKNANQSLWEGVFGMVTAVFVAILVIHMWRTAAHLKRDMENRLTLATENKTTVAAAVGVFLFTVFMITREGMETALLLIQIHEARIVTGALFGILAAGALAMIWGRFGYLINLKLFFQVTAVFLLLVVVQVLFNSFHEFTETGLLPYSEVLHNATENFSADGHYGKWFTPAMVAFCALWFAAAWFQDRFLSTSGKAK